MNEPTIIILFVMVFAGTADRTQEIPSQVAEFSSLKNCETAKRVFERSHTGSPHERKYFCLRY